jgi:hypothetical protein
MATLFNAQDRTRILERLERLTPDARPHWGTFTPVLMVGHVASGIQQGLGEVDLGPARGALARWPLNWLLIHVVPFPKHAPAVPEMLNRPSAGFSADLAALRAAVERFGVRGRGGQWPPSRVFGRISGTSWGVLQHKHLDHHLRQFGL